MRSSLLYTIALSALVLGCDEPASSDDKTAREPKASERDIEVRLSRDLRNQITWDSHPTEVFDATWEFYGGQRKPKPEVQKYTRRSGDQKHHLSARARAESSTSDAVRYFQGQAEKYLKPGTHTRNAIAGLGDEAILGLSSTGGNNHLFVRIGPIFLEVRSKEPAETMRSCAMAYERAMRDALEEHLE